MLPKFTFGILWIYFIGRTSYSKLAKNHKKSLTAFIIRFWKKHCFPWTLRCSKQAKKHQISLASQPLKLYANAVCRSYAKAMHGIYQSHSHGFLTLLLAQLCRKVVGRRIASLNLRPVGHVEKHFFSMTSPVVKSHKKALNIHGWANCNSDKNASTLHFNKRNILKRIKRGFSKKYAYFSGRLPRQRWCVFSSDSMN